MNRLQKALRINAIFSIVSGLTLIIFHQKIALLFGIVNPTVFWVVGAALLVFSATIVYEIFKQRSLKSAFAAFHLLQTVIFASKLFVTNK